MEVTPYAPSVAWWRENLLTGQSPRCERPNRTLIPGNRGPVWLTIPVVSGSDPALISAHGKWAHVHLEALRAVYGKAPYFPHYEAELAELYASPSGELRLFNERVKQFIESKLRFEETGRLRRLPREILEEYRAKARGELSVYDILFRLGPAATLALV